MFEQDYIMRIIKEIIRMLLKLLFHIDAQAADSELLENREERVSLDDLLDLVDRGDINSAENRLYEETLDGDMGKLKKALLFYSYLNDKSDSFLEEHGFSRKEVKEGVLDLVSRYGLEGMVEVFLADL